MTDENINAQRGEDNQAQPGAVEALRARVQAAVEALDKQVMAYLGQAGKSEEAARADDAARKLESAFDGWVAAGAVDEFISPVDLRAYGLGYLGIASAEGAAAETVEAPAAVTPVKTVEVPEKTETSREMQVRQFKIQAQKDLDDRKYPEALDQVKKALAVDPYDDDALKLERKIKDTQKEHDLRRLKETLKKADKIVALEKAVQEAETWLVTPGFEDPDLEQLKEEARLRRDNIKKEMGIHSSSAMLNEYVPAYNAFVDANARMIAGETDYFNQRVGTNVPIVEFIKEVQEQLVKLAAEFMRGKLDRAADLMPKDGPRSPLAAKKELDETKIVRTQELFGSSEDSRLKRGQGGAKDDAYQKALQELRAVNEKVQAELARCEREGEKWQAADNELKLAGDNQDALARLNHFKLARAAYRYHEGINQNEAAYYSQANAYLIEEIQQAVARGMAHLDREEQEALQQREDGKISQLQVFLQARGEVEHMGRLLVDIDETWRSDALKAAMQQLDVFTRQVEARAKRRSKIRAEYATLATLLKDNKATLAMETYRALPPDFKEDGEIKLLYTSLAGGMSDEDHLKEAESAYATGNWQRVIDECAHIRRVESAIKRAGVLRGMARLFLLRRTIETAWQKRYYDDCEEEILNLLMLQEEEAEVQQQASKMIVELQLDQKQGDIRRMKQVDDRFQVPGKFARVEKDLSALTDAAGAYKLAGEGDANLDQLVALYDRVVELDDTCDEVDGKLVFSTRKGKLADLRAKLQAALREGLTLEVKASLERKPKDLDRAHRLATLLHSRALDSGKVSAQACREAVEAYYQVKVNEWVSKNKWKSAVGSLEQAVNEYADLYVIREMLDKQRRACLLYSVDTNLRNDWKQAGRLLNKEERPAAIGDNPPFSFSVEEDPGLRLRSRVYKKFEDAQILYRDGKYENATTFVKNINLKALALARKPGEDEEESSQSTKEVVIEEEARLKEAIRYHAVKLTETGIGDLALVANDEEGKLAERAFAYARILQLDPENMVAKTWIEANAKELQAQVDDRVERVRRLVIDSRQVKDQLEDAQALLDAVEDLLAAVPNFGNKTEQEENRKDLSNVRKKLVDTLLPKLKRAAELLAAYGPKGENWLKCVSQGNWDDANKAAAELNTLLKLDSKRHDEVLELETRIRDFSQDRRDLETAQDKLRKLLPVDDFAGAETELKTIERIMRSHGVTQPGQDPFQLVTTGYGIFDDFLSAKVFYYPQDGSDQTIAKLIKDRGANAVEWNNYHAALLRLYKELAGMPEQDSPVYSIAHDDAVREKLEAIGYAAPTVDLARPTLKMKENLEAFLIRLLMREGEGQAETQARLDEYLYDPAQQKDQDPQPPVDQAAAWCVKTNQELAQLVRDGKVVIGRIKAQPARPMSTKAEDICERVTWMISRLHGVLAKAMTDWVAVYKVEKDNRALLDNLVKGVQGSNEEQYNQARELARFWKGSSESDLSEFLEHMVAVTGGEVPDANRAA